MPTQKPDNKIIRIAESTVNLPSTGKVNKQVPSFDLRTVGYDKNKRIFAEELNYTLDNIGQWCQWFENRTDELQVRTEELQEELETRTAQLEAQIEKERVSIGELIEITGDSTNPSILKGYGTWEYFGEGLTTIGVGTHTDDRSEELTFTDGQTLGEYKHVQTESEIGTHGHGGTTDENSHAHGYARTSSFSAEQSGSGSSLPYTNTIPADGTSALGPTGGFEGPAVSLSITNTWAASAETPHSHTITASDTGGSDPMNNIQPSVAVYRWKRTS